MSQLVKFNTTPSLRSMFENLWDNDLLDEDVLRKAKMPAVNVKDKDKSYEIEVAAPGLKKEDFSVGIENKILTISAEKKEEKETKDDKYTRREFISSSFVRSFSLPENVDENKIEGHYENGVLHVTVPKLQEKKPERKTIPLS
ncbi:MAG TPA: Hsp20/alpha crystallin family protein [Puia sp.]|nr:Hsp20/alpha crystallin family protein [Puia sp.]